LAHPAPDPIRAIVSSYESPIIRSCARLRFTVLRQIFLEEIDQYLPMTGRLLDVACGFAFPRRGRSGDREAPQLLSVTARVSTDHDPIGTQAAGRDHILAGFEEDRRGAVRRLDVLRVDDQPSAALMGRAEQDGQTHTDEAARSHLAPPLALVYRPGWSAP